MSSGHVAHYGSSRDRNQNATIWVGNLAQAVDSDLIYELCIQFGQVAEVTLNTDKISGEHLGYAFVEYKNVESAEYAMRCMTNVQLFGKPVRVNKSSRTAETSSGKENEKGVGANLFVRGLHDDVDDVYLRQLCSPFGLLLKVYVVRDEEGRSKGFAFVDFDSFEASDACMEALNGQFVMSRPCFVSYAFKEGTQETHGDRAERMLAAKMKKSESTSLVTATTIQQHLGNNSFHSMPSSFAPPPLPMASLRMHQSAPPPLPPFGQMGMAPPPLFNVSSMMGGNVMGPPPMGKPPPLI
jgi:splicing factor 3B subunit 4